MQIDRTPEELTAYVKRLEATAYRLVGDTEEYEALMEEGKLHNITYVEALEWLILSKAEGVD